MQAVSSADSFADTTFFRYMSIRLIVFLALLRYNLERWFSKDDLHVPVECSGEDVSRREPSASAGCEIIDIMKQGGTGFDEMEA